MYQFKIIKLRGEAMGYTNDAGNKTILVVDDEDCLVAYLEMLLAHEGYNVVTASNGKQAVEVYKTKSDEIDIVLMDITMPILDGIQTYKQLTQYNPNVPILFMSAYSQQSLEGIENLHFIRKPMRPREILQSIEHIFDSSKSVSLPAGSDTV